MRSTELESTVTGRIGLRDFFTAVAMHALLVTNRGLDYMPDDNLTKFGGPRAPTFSELASRAYEIADALLACPSRRGSAEPDAE
jgi:hypothetical protein